MQFILLYVSIFLGYFGDSSPEQLAFKYFMEVIYMDNYSDKKAVYFSGMSEGKRSIAGPFSNCFALDEGFKNILYNIKTEEADQIIIQKGNWSGIKFIRKPKSKRLSIEIYRSVKIDDFNYVYISVYKPKEFVDHFLIKATDQEVIEYCQINEVI